MTQPGSIVSQNANVVHNWTAYEDQFINGDTVRIIEGQLNLSSVALLRGDTQVQSQDDPTGDFDDNFNINGELTVGIGIAGAGYKHTVNVDTGEHEVNITGSILGLGADVVFKFDSNLELIDVSGTVGGVIIAGLEARVGGFAIGGDIVSRLGVNLSRDGINLEGSFTLGISAIVARGELAYKVLSDVDIWSDRTVYSADWGIDWSTLISSNQTNRVLVDTRIDGDGAGFLSEYTYSGARYIDGEKITFILERQKTFDENGALVRVQGHGTLHTVYKVKSDGSIDSVRCFLPDTKITMSDGSLKRIDKIKAGDYVLTFDTTFGGGRGALVSKRVTETYVNSVTTVLDFFGTGITPGHVTLCGEGRYSGRCVPIIDILTSDGAIVKDDGTLIRAATNCEVGSLDDRFVHLAWFKDAVAAEARKPEMRQLRLGTKILRADGSTISFREMIESTGMEILGNGLVRYEGQEMPAQWVGPFPTPEQYVLAKSGLTMADITGDPHGEEHASLRRRSYGEAVH